MLIQAARRLSTSLSKRCLCGRTWSDLDAGEYEGCKECRRLLSSHIGDLGDHIQFWDIAYDNCNVEAMGSAYPDECRKFLNKLRTARLDADLNVVPDEFVYVTASSAVESISFQNCHFPYFFTAYLAG